MADGKVEIDVELNSRNVDSQANKLGKTINRGVSKACKVATASVAAVGAASVAALGTAVKVGSSFESQMSIVAAISGATSGELERLSAKAKEMGEKTAFSATEAAKAFEYMAMAGWKTDEMLNGIEGIMDLAAASGEDLATTSDIVTDALTAFNLKAKDSAHFSDILAQASSNANTNVSMMGETFKYVAPVAGSMGYSAEDTAKAIGLMANSGIKASQAGTSLRSIISRMADPTDKVEEAMKKLGIRLTDSNGNMRSLDDVMKDLRDSFSKLAPEQKAQYASTIAGKNAMSGMLAIVNASEKDYDKLTKAIANADGASKRMAETRLDNWKGDVTILRSKLEALGITMYESVDTPLRDITKGAQETVEALNTAMSGGGFDVLAQTIGSQLGSITSKAIEVLPDLADISIVIISKFGTSLIQSASTTLPKFINSLGKILSKLVTQAFGDVAGKSVENLFKTISSNIIPVLRSITGIIRQVISAMSPFITMTSNAASFIIPLLTSALEMLNDNMNWLIPTVLAVGVAMAAVWIAQNWSMIIGTVEFAVSKLFAVMLANPIMALVAGITALTAAIVAYNMSASGATSETEAVMAKTAALNEKINITRESIDEMATSYQSLSNASAQRIADIDTEFAQTESYWNELKKITDENGNIKKGYEDRAAFITGELSSALGTEISIVNNQIQDYKELNGSIEKTIAMKRLEATIDAKTQEYNKAKEQEVQLAANQTDAQMQYNEAMSNALKLSDERKKKFAEGKEVTEAETQAWIDAWDAAGKAQTNLTDATKQLTEAQTTIANYDKAVNNVGKSTKKMNKASEDLATGFKKYGDVSKEALEEQANSAVENFDKIKKAYDTGNTHITKKQVETAKKQAERALKEYQKCGEDTVGGYINGINERKGELSDAVITMVNESLNAGKKAAKINSPSKITTDDGRFLARGYVKGFQEEDPARRITQTFRHSMRTIDNAMNGEVIHTMRLGGFDTIGDAMVHSLQKAGLTISINGRQFGRVVKEVTG